MRTESKGRPLPHHLVRYGIPREAKYLAGEFADTYDMLVINGNSAAYMPSALTSFLSSKLYGKAFMIDPMTHAFQHASAHVMSMTTGEPKRSINKLAEALGEPFVSRLNERRPIVPSDFAGRRANEVVERVISFQADGFVRAAEESGDVDYLQFINATTSLRPHFVVAPYFYMDEDEIQAQEWAKVNARMVQTAASVFGSKFNVIAQLVLHQGLMESRIVDDLVRDIADTSIKAIAVWVDSLDESEISLSTLKAYSNLLRRIGSFKPVYILYGSYFTVVLSHLFPEIGIAGVCHGLEYGESRAVVPVGGGLPISKFYYPSLHSRVPFDDALRLARDFLASRKLYEDYICSCRMCSTLLDESKTVEAAFLKYGEANAVMMTQRGQSFLRNFPTMDARDRCVRHYMDVKWREYRTSVSAGDVISSLKQAGSYATEKVGSSAGRHCLVWARAIEGIREDVQ